MLGFQREHFSSNSGYYVAKNREYRARLREIVKQAKSKPCMDCGHVYPYYVMDFDHVRGKKLMEIPRLIVLQSRIKLLEEIKKCDVVCANCHRIRTHNRNGASDRTSTRASRSEDERDMQFHHGGDS